MSLPTILNIASREWIEAALDDYEGTLIFVSHDRYFVEQFATRIWELQDGSIRDFPFGYEKYRSTLEKERESRQQAPSAGKKQNGKLPNAPKPKNPARLLEKLETQISKQEELIAQLDQQIEEAATDYEQLQTLLSEKEQRSQELEAFYQEWEELSLAVETTNSES